MSFISEDWASFDASGLKIFINAHKAAWFVPNKAGERILSGFESGKVPGDESRISGFIARLPDSNFNEYKGRQNHLKPENIRELWFHITDNCNLKCRHCLFSSAPELRDSISIELIKGYISEAYSLGCRMFVLTGGEPFVHPDILDIISYVTGFADAHVVVLTNGIFHEKMLSAKRIAPEKVHLQISLDGLKESNDIIRGEGAFDRTMESLKKLRIEGFAFTLSMCVTSDNYRQIPEMVELAAELGAENLHYMWYFVKGRGGNEGFVDPKDIYSYLIEATLRAEELSINIDNVSEIRSRVFSPQGTIHDGGAAAWETLAIGPDMKLYPSAAVIGNEELGSSLENGINAAWKKSPIMEQIREASIVSLDDPFRFILGGGDFDHSYLSSGKFIGSDPYYKMYADLALWLISREAKKYIKEARPGLALKMGDILKTCGEHGSVSLCHSNCLLDVASTDVRSSVAAFYSKAASADSEEILNPVCYPDEYIEHIPQKYRFRGYGCGSPVMDANIEEGFSIADLGSGRGIECFIAAKLVGASGRVIGIDMLDPMLEKARLGALEVAENLGYDNLEFKKGFLENLPLEDNSCDVMTSNCVLNLSPDKRKTFSEVFRALKPGGRLVVSDVVCDEEPDASVRNDEKLRGECIAGAMTQKDLVGILHESGFVSVRLIRRFPYRSVSGHDFFSLTFSAYKPSYGSEVQVIYRGAFDSAITSSGKILHAGIKTLIDSSEAASLGEDIFIVDAHGSVINMQFGESSCCCVPDNNPGVSCCTGASDSCNTCSDDSGPDSCCSCGNERHMSGCMICGASLYYSSHSGKEEACHYCGKTGKADMICERGHFVCDSCHAADALGIIRRYLVSTDQKDMTLMFDALKSHDKIPMHGPEHHALVAGIIVTSYLNTKGEKNEAMILEAIERGSRIAGGSCGYTGVCGAASGTGIGFAVILESSPVKPAARKMVQTIVHEVLGEIAKFEAARCCQRDGWVALRKASEISPRFLPFKLPGDHVISCVLCGENSECIGDECPLFN